LSNHQVSKPVSADGDQFGHVEVRGIDYIPQAERHGHARELFLLWLAPNIMYLDVILGGVMMKLGMGIWTAIAVIVAGNAYWLLVGLVSISGARAGTAGAVIMRAMFGVRANRVNVAISVWAIMVAYEAVNLSMGGLAGFALIQAVGITPTFGWKLATVLVISAVTITIRNLRDEPNLGTITLFPEGRGGGASRVSERVGERRHGPKGPCPGGPDGRTG